MGLAEAWKLGKWSQGCVVDSRWAGGRGRWVIMAPGDGEQGPWGATWVWQWVGRAPGRWGEPMVAGVIILGSGIRDVRRQGSAAQVPQGCCIAALSLNATSSIGWKGPGFGPPDVGTMGL